MQMALNRALIPCMWRRISDYIPEIKPYYFISSFGDVFNEKRSYYLHATIDRYGYHKIKIPCNDNIARKYSIHRLVMICFCPIGNFDELEVNHMNAVKGKNDIGNLEWCTRKENINHAINMGLWKIGEERRGAILTNDQVHIICQGLMQQVSYRDICEKMLGIESTPNINFIISSIRTRRKWKSISKYYDFPEMTRSSQKFTNDQARIVCEALQNGIIGGRAILEILGFEFDSLSLYERNSIYGVISRIKNRKFYTEISKDYNF